MTIETWGHWGHFIEIHDDWGHVGNIFWINSSPAPYMDLLCRSWAIRWGAFLLHPPEEAISYCETQWIGMPIGRARARS